MQKGGKKFGSFSYENLDRKCQMCIRDRYMNRSLSGAASVACLFSLYSWNRCLVYSCLKVAEVAAFHCRFCFWLVPPLSLPRGTRIFDLRSALFSYAHNNALKLGLDLSQSSTRGIQIVIINTHWWLQVKTRYV